MAVVIPTRTAIGVLAGIAVVYFTVTVVLIVVYIGCYLHHRKPKKALTTTPELGANNRLREVEEEEEEDGNDSSESVTLRLSSASSGVASYINTQDTNGRHLSSRNQIQPSQDGQSDPPPPQTSPSPKLIQHVVLPPLRHRPPIPKLPSLSTSSSSDWKDTQLEKDKEAYSTSTLPRVKDTGKEYTVLTMHKSTLRRKRKSAKIEPTEETIGESNSDFECISSHESKDSMKLGQFKEAPKRPRVARTESTKPLIEDLEEDDSPSSEQMPGLEQFTLQEDLVLTNENTQEDEAQPLNTLQSDIMDMITAL